MHFCGGLDDLLYLIMLVPGLGFALAWLRAKFHHGRTHAACGAPVNQCDGCRQGAPINQYGHHYMSGSRIPFMVCERKEYE